MQPILAGISLVNAPRQPKRLPQMATVRQHAAAYLRRPPLQQTLGYWFRGRLTPELLPVPPPPCDPRHLPLASELPSLISATLHTQPAYPSISSSNRSISLAAHPATFQPDAFQMSHSLSAPAVSTVTTEYRPTPSPSSNTTGFHRATQLRSPSSRRSVPADSLPAPLHRDGYHLVVSAQTMAHYLPQSLCARHPTLSSCLLYTSPSPRDRQKSRMPSSA